MYRFRLEAGHSLHLAIDQDDVDVVCELFDPRGESLIVVDSLEGAWGSEDVFWLAEEAGDYLLEIRSWDPASRGHYEMRTLHLGPAREGDARRAEATRYFDAAERLRRGGSYSDAVAPYEKALALWQELGEEARAAQTLYLLGNIRASRSLHPAAIASYSRSLPLFEAVGNTRMRASALHQIGRSHFALGEFGTARRRYGEALELRRALGDPLALVFTLNNLGLTNAFLGEYQDALNFYAEALGLAREIGNRRQEGKVLENRGKCYLYLGRFQQAFDDLTRAVEIHEETGDRKEQATAFAGIGLVYEAWALYSEPGATDAESLENALSYLERAREIHAETGNRRHQAMTLVILGRIHRWSGDELRAHESFSAALEIVRELEDRYREALILHELGSLLLSQGRIETALAYLGEALPLFAETGGQLEVDTLEKMALAERERGDLAAARRRIEEALDKYELLRVKPASPSLRSSFFALRQDFYDFYVDLLMEYHRRRPQEGYDALALAASERARARSQLETLVESGADLGRGADSRLLARRRALEEEVSARELQRLRLLEEGLPPDQIAPLDRELRTLLRDYDEVRSRIRLASPLRSAMTRPRLLGAEEIQQQLDRESLLVQYDLGEQRGYMWAVTRDEIVSFELPGRRRIESMARRLYDLLVVSHRRESRLPTRTALADASDLLLRPLAGLLEGRRLLIVAEGALRYVPFGALPRPGEGGPLVSSSEITYIPSVSTIAELRRQLASRERAAASLAVVADPVFQRHDPRATEDSSPAPSPAALRGGPPDLRRFERLVFSEEEARALLGMVAPEDRFEALGFAANREVVLAGRLKGYRIVHFATHGYVDAEHPELSRLVLSLVDESGRPLDGFLFAHEIYDLELSAELVVLSACRTALGVEIRGEGLVGLTQAFMYAGAARVLTSLWQVDDQATAELMSRFYRHLLEGGLRPAEALRRAQLSVSRETRWQAPYYWAGFVLRGEM